MMRFARQLINRFGFDVRRYKRPEADVNVYRDHYPAESIAKRRFYNIGAGDFRHPCWTNVDKVSDWYKAQQHGGLVDYDLLKSENLPIADASAELFYSSHTIEHIDDASAKRLFREAHRCLKPGGILRVVCPNIDLDYQAWKSGDRSHFYWAERYSRPSEMERAKIRTPMNAASLEQIFLYHFVASASTLHADGVASPLSDSEMRELFNTLSYEEALDACVRRGSLEVQLRNPGNHINWWNPKKVCAYLEDAGFGEVFTSAYGQSRAPVMRNTDLFDRTHPRLSLYVEAVR